MFSYTLRLDHEVLIFVTVHDTWGFTGTSPSNMSVSVSERQWREVHQLLVRCFHSQIYSSHLQLCLTVLEFKCYYSQPLIQLYRIENPFSLTIFQVSTISNIDYSEWISNYYPVHFDHPYFGCYTDGFLSVKAVNCTFLGKFQPTFIYFRECTEYFLVSSLRRQSFVPVGGWTCTQKGERWTWPTSESVTA